MNKKSVTAYPLNVTKCSVTKYISAAKTSILWTESVFFQKEVCKTLFTKTFKQSYCVIKLYNTDHMDILKCIA